MPTARAKLARILVRANRSMDSIFSRTLEARRFSFSHVTPRFFLGSKDVSLEDADVEGIGACWVVPRGADRSRAILYLHGGSYVSGSIASHRKMVSWLAVEAGLPALIIDYRLAPQDRFPAAVQDSLKGYRWLLSRGLEPGGIVLAGDSAGGGLAVSTMLSARDSGDPMPAAGVLLSPWTDMTLSGESWCTRVRDDPMLSTGLLKSEAEMYLAGADPCDPLASPVFADLEGLPPLLVLVGTAEILLDDSVRLAEAAAAAGVSVELDVWDGMFHVWPYFAPVVPESRSALGKAGCFARAAAKNTLLPD
jgi:acetyl esterase/lipase